MADLDSYSFVRRSGSLVPRDVHAEELLSSIRDGGEVMVSVRRARNPRHHRLAFAFFNFLVDNTDGRWESVEECLQDMKLATGHYEKRVNAITGEVMLIPKSISFAAMDQEKFGRWWRRAIHVACTRIIPMLPAEMEAAILEIVGDREPTSPSRPSSRRRSSP